MKLHYLQREQLIPRSLEATFDFFASAENLEAITPRWLGFEIISAPAQLEAGSELIYQLKWHGFPLRWKTEITKWIPPVEFQDVQKSGPYRVWRHTHRFSQHPGGTLMSDRVEYALPFGIIGEIFHRFKVARDLNGIFDYRSERICELLAEDRGAANSPPGTGLIL